MSELPINQVVTGDCREVMAGWPSNCIDFVMFSPLSLNIERTKHTRMSRKKITDEEIEKGVEQGLTDKEIAEKHDVTYPTVVRRRKKLDILPNPPESKIELPDVPKEDAGYMAGIIDGEGSIMIKKSTWGMRNGKGKSPTYSERISIKMKDKPPLELFRDYFGGRLSSKNKRGLFVYDSTDKIAVKVVKTVYPYLKIKKKQADLLLDLRKDKVEGRGRFRGGPTGRKMPQEVIDFRENLYREVRKLNE